MLPSTLTGWLFYLAHLAAGCGLTVAGMAWYPCCSTDDPCDLLASSGAFVSVAGVWTTGSDGGHSYQGTSSTSAVIKWSHASAFGNNYNFNAWLKIQNASDIGMLLFNYDLTADTYDRVEFEAGAAGTGAGGKVRLYVGGVLQTETNATIVPGTWYRASMCSGMVIVNTCAAASVDHNTINTVGVMFASAFDTDGAHTYGWAPFTISPTTGGFGFGSGSANTGYVRFEPNTWLKTNEVGDDTSGGYDCGECTDACGYCADASRKVYCTVTIDTPAGVPYVGIFNSAFVNQVYETYYFNTAPGGCGWDYHDTRNDGAFNYTVTIQVAVICCSGDYYLCVKLQINHPIFGIFYECYYYELVAWDFDCGIVSFTFDDSNFVPGFGTPNSACGGLATNTGNTGEYVKGTNTITVEFHN